MAITGISQKEYLKKYLSGKDDKKRKKKKLKTNPAVNRMKIVDDDIDISAIKPLNDDELELDLYELQEDAPQIAGIIDERPEEVKNKEKFAPRKWKIIADENDSGVKVIDKSNSNVQSTMKGRFRDEDLSPVRNIKVRDEKDFPRQSKEFHASQLQKNKSNDSDESPPRNSRKNDGVEHRSDSDESLPKKLSNKSSERVYTSKNNHRYDSDESPPRKTKRSSESVQIIKSLYKRDSDESPPRRTQEKDYHTAQSNKSRYKHDSDELPPRQNQERNKYLASEKKSQKYDSDESPPRKNKRNSPRHSQLYRKGQRYDSDESPPRRTKKDTDLPFSWGSKHRSDLKRGNVRDTSLSNRDFKDSPPRSREKTRNANVCQNGSDSDESPPRKNKRSLTPPNKTRRYSHSPQHGREKSKISRSPPFKSSKGVDIRDSSRKTSKWTDEQSLKRRESSKYRPSPRRFQDSGFSHREFDYSDRKKDGRGPSSQRRQENDKSSEVTKEVSKDSAKVTMDGRKAGLVGAGELKAEIADMRQREKQVFETMDPSVSGKGAAAIMRDRKTGKKRDLAEEAKVQKEKDEKQAERDAKYVQWGKGLKQVTEHEEKLKEALHEMSKPLARYADDEDLDKFLREQEREGDPMLAYIKSKSREKEDKGKPQYEGSYMPNRFGIRPGHRWDGVDRSNGYEKQWFEAENSRKAVEEEAYKWSTSDM